MKWTQAQEKTIETRGRNILVSAAAGSGKTTVMIERIKQLVLRDHIDIDRFLITTFTRAAASEMKEKMEKAIRGELAQLQKEGDAGREETAFLQRQLSLLPRADISTFHTFAIGILREFFYLTDLDPGFAVGDEVRVSILRKECMDEIIEERFEGGGEAFRSFVRDYSGDRSDDALKDNLLEIYGQLRSLPHYLSWAEEACGKLGSGDPLTETGAGQFILEESVRLLAESAAYHRRAEEILRESGAESIWMKVRQDAEGAEALVETAKAEAHMAASGAPAAGALQTLREAVFSFKTSILRSRKAEEDAWILLKEQVGDLRKQAKKPLDDLKKKYLKQDPEQAGEALGKLYEDTACFIGLLSELDRRYAEKKRELNIIDFDDVMHEAIRILENEEAAAEYRNRFAYIFIDEYQDSNLLQEEIIGRIAREDNLFMVGDIKQSIYRFRLAEPEIFRSRYLAYRSRDPHSVKIDLNSNFRSRKTVRDAVNRIFEMVMEGYDEDARLYGSEDPEHPGAPAGLHIIDRSGGGDEEDSVEELTESAVVAEIIRDCVGTSFTDRDGTVRPIGYGDIAVLSRGGAAIPEVERYLNNDGIPAFGESAGGYYETVEIQVFLNLLRVISNLRQDIPLISAMSSVVFDFTPAELVHVRIFTREGSFHMAVLRYAQEGPDADLKRKICEMLEQIALWMEMARIVPLDELMRKLLYETGYYDYCSGLPVGRQRISNLRLLLEKAAVFEETNHSGLFGFLSYVEEMKKSDQKIEVAQSGGESGDVVRVMTVHKSKGLEFPVVILTGAGKRINSAKSGKPAVMHRAFGIGLPEVSRSMHWERKTLLQRAVIGRKNRENLEEEIRILYVALTRAMERLEIVGRVKDVDKLPEIMSTGSYLEMVYPAFAEMAEEDPSAAYIEILNGTVPGESGDPAAPEALSGGGGTESSEDPDDARSPQEREAFLQEMNRRLSYVYPYRTPRAAKQKYSVTELNRMESTEKPDVPVTVPRLREFGESEEPQPLGAAETGTVMHTLMERIDFSRAVSEGMPYLEAFLGELQETGILTEEEAGAANLANILRFFETEVSRRAAASGNMQREKEFLMRREVEGVPSIVQGIIDCFFEEEDGIVLIDYKNSFASTAEQKQEMLKRYGPQIHLYREALQQAAGKPVKESWLYLFRSGTLIAVE